MGEGDLMTVDGGRRAATFCQRSYLSREDGRHSFVEGSRPEVMMRTTHPLELGPMTTLPTTAVRFARVPVTLGMTFVAPARNAAEVDV